MDFDFDNSAANWRLNLKAVSKFEQYPAYVRLLAARITENQCMTLEYFFTKFLTKSDLEHLSKLSSNVAEKLMLLASTEDSEKSDELIQDYDVLLVLAWILSLAEGTLEKINVGDPNEYAVMSQKVNSLISFVTLASLERKGFVKIHWENMTFDPDYIDAPIAERITR